MGRAGFLPGSCSGGDLGPYFRGGLAAPAATCAGTGARDQAGVSYSLLGVLRLLLVVAEEDAAREQVALLMDHWEELVAKDPGLEEAIARLADFYRSKLGLPWVTEEQVRHCYGVLKTNSMRVGLGEAQVVFPNLSIASHSCVSNLELVGEVGATVAFRAKRRIMEGEELTLRYTSFLQPAEGIQEGLSIWHFACTCARCSDPSELGSNFSSLQCACGGFYRRAGAAHRCSACGGEAGLAHRLARVGELARRLEAEGWSQEVDQEMEAMDGCHATFHLRIQVYMVDLERGWQVGQARRVVERATKVTRLLAILDPGCTKLLGRCLTPATWYLTPCNQNLSGTSA